MELSKGWLDEQTVFLYSISPSASEISRKAGANAYLSRFIPETGELPASPGRNLADAGVKPSTAEQPELARSSGYAL
jgi:hypothetical protein